MNAPIPVSEALKLLSMARAQTDGYSDDLGCCGSCVLARATMRPLLEAIRTRLKMGLWLNGVILDDQDIYPPLAALMAHYDATRPDWRTR